MDGTVGDNCRSLGDQNKDGKHFSSPCSEYVLSTMKISDIKPDIIIRGAVLPEPIHIVSVTTMGEPVDLH